MVDVECTKAYLLERFGIRNEQELAKAMQRMERLKIGLFTARTEDVNDSTDS